MNRTFSFLVIIAFTLGGIAAACTSTSAPKLSGSAWELLELNGESLPADVDITLILDQDGAGGRAACNSYGGSFKQSGTRVSFSEIFQTEMWCEGLMDYESSYLLKLAGVSSFTLTGDRLSLQDDSGSPVLVFIRQ